MIWLNRTHGRDYSHFEVGDVVSMRESEDLCSFDNRYSYWWRQSPNKIGGIVDVFYVVTAIQKGLEGTIELSLITRAFKNPCSGEGYVSDEKVPDGISSTKEIDIQDISNRLRKKLVNSISDRIGNIYRVPMMEREE